MLKYSVDHMKYVCSPEAAACDCQFSPLNFPCFWQEKGEWAQESPEEIRPLPVSRGQARNQEVRWEGQTTRVPFPALLPVSSGTLGKLINLSVSPFSHQPSEP